MSGAALAAAWVSAALLAAEPSEPVDRLEVGREITEILAEDRYYFCAADNEYVPDSDDQRWCELAAAENFARCPGYAAVCGREIPGGEFNLRGGPGGSEEQPDKKPGEANKNAHYENEGFKLPDLGVFARILMWLLLIGGVAAIVYVIAKNLIRDRDEDQGPELDADPEAGESLIAARAAAMRVVETDVRRLLARAEQAAARGDHEAAINDVHAALLRRLEGEQLISVDRWKTNGDYIAELRSRLALRDEVREIVREVEQVQFGAAAAEASRYASVRAKVLAIVGRAALAFMVMLGGATVLGCPNPSSALAGLGTGPTGKRAVGELFLKFDIDARHRTQTIEQLAQTHGAIILLEGVELLDEDWDTLIAWVEEDGGTLVIATGEDFPRRFGVDYMPAAGTSTALEVPESLYSYNRLELGAPPGRLLDLGLGTGAYSEELLVREVEDAWDTGLTKPYVVARKLGSEGGEIIVFAEPDMLTNAGISVGNTGAFLINLLRSREIDEVEFIDQYTGSGPDDPFEGVSNARLGALFVQILLFLALLYAAVGIPFARLRDPAEQRRRSFVEHVRTLGQRYAQARAARYVAGLYGAWVLDRLRERLQPGTARGLHPLAQAIAARTGRDEGQVMQLLVAVHDLREHGSTGRGGSADLELMRQLAKLLDEIGGSR